MLKKYGKNKNAQDVTDNDKKVIKNQIKNVKPNGVNF